MTDVYRPTEVTVLVLPPGRVGIRLQPADMAHAVTVTLSRAEALRLRAALDEAVGLP